MISVLSFFRCAGRSNQLIFRTSAIFEARSLTSLTTSWFAKSNTFSPSLTPPRRPLTPYFEFLLENRAKLKQENPNLKLTELSRTAGVLWHGLSEEKKQVYKKKAENEKVEYDKKYKAFFDSLSAEQKTKFAEEQAKLSEDRKVHRQKLKKRRHRMELKKLDKPKRNPTSFALFVKAQELERGDAPLSQYVKGLAEHWKKMAEEDKQKYYDEAKRLREIYVAALAKWEQKMEDAGMPELIRGHKAPKKKTSTRPKAAKKGAKLTTGKTKTRRVSAKRGSSSSKTGSKKSAATKASKKATPAETKKSADTSGKTAAKTKAGGRKKQPVDVAKEAEWMRGA